MENKTEFIFKPIGYVRNKSVSVPRHWSVSDIEGELVIDSQYKDGIKDIKAKEKICVIFCFHKSPPFSQEKLTQKPPHIDAEKGVFSICSPYRPNPIGLSVLEVLEKSENVIKVRRLDMLDGTPILDIKPYVEYKEF
ncbi:tRNA (N6-threonylcarbamoyladenosine(37)-N6)-methyltransferase TrmO [Thermodesulfobium sp.]